MTTQQQPLPPFRLMVVGQGQGGSQYPGYKQHLRQARSPHFKEDFYGLLISTYAPDVQQPIAVETMGWITQHCVILADDGMIFF